MKRRGLLILAVVSALAFLSLFPTWNFSERTQISQEKNPLWDDELKPINSALTNPLREEGLSFQTGRGAEADPDGICYGDFGSDEYWVVQYNPAKKEVDASAWIIGTNWIGHLQAQRRFTRIKAIIEDSTKTKQ
jgi:hypothetical protein